jgi:hypothetical protein
MVAADSGLARRMRLMFSHLISFLARRYTSQGARAKHGKITNNTNLWRVVTKMLELKLARLSEAGYAFETKLRELEYQFDAAASSLREAYLGEVLEIHGSVAQ